MLKEINSINEFNEVIKKGVKVVDFYADWCGPCRMLGPILHELADEYNGKIDVLKVNVDKMEELASKYNVSSIPLVVIIKDGATVETLLGYRPKGAYKKIIDNLI